MDNQKSYYEQDCYNKDGYNPCTRLYKSRYYAQKAAYGNEVVVKVCGGYMRMDAADYWVWRKQK